MAELLPTTNQGDASRSRSTEDPTLESEPLIAPRVNHELDEYRDGVLPYDNGAAQAGGAPQKNWPSLARLRKECLRALPLLVLSVFLASCPIPRALLSDSLRLVLTTFVASLTTFAASHRVLLSRRERILRTLAAYSGFYLSMYAIFGASDGVHIDLRWQSLLWYPTYKGFQLGYGSRWVLIFLGYRIQKSAGLHSRNSILGSYLLSLVLVYIDIPTTIFDLARGRAHW